MNTEPDAVGESAFAGDPPLDLLEWIAAGDQAERNAAARELLGRYRGWLFAKLKKSLRQCDDDTVGELVMETFQKAINGAHTFRKPDGESVEVQDRRFRRWLLVIARNVLNAWYRANRVFVTGDDLFWQQVDHELSSQPAPPPPPAVVEVVRGVMAELSERDSDILNTYLSHCPSVTNPQAKLPRKVIAELCTRYDTTPENLRALRSRAMRKMKAKLEDRGIR